MITMRLLSILFVLTFVLSSCKDSKGIINSNSGLVLRTNPSNSAERIDLIPNGTEVFILDKNGPRDTIYGISSNWYEVKYNGKRGWAFGGLINLKGEQNKSQTESYQTTQNQETEQKEGTKLEMCQGEAGKKIIGKSGYAYNPNSGRNELCVQETLILKCEYGDLYVSGSVFNKDIGYRVDQGWTQSNEIKECPNTVAKYGSICK